jgi:hypothetical protein
MGKIQKKFRIILYLMILIDDIIGAKEKQRAADVCFPVLRKNGADREKEERWCPAFDFKIK